jgi:hypothetical protein
MKNYTKKFWENLPKQNSLNASNVQNAQGAAQLSNF